MKRVLSVLYDIFLILGFTLFISRMGGYVLDWLGWREILIANKWLLVVYELVILTGVTLAMCWYNRSQKEKEEQTVCVEDKESAIRELRRVLPKPAVVLRSTPAEQLPEGKVSCLGRVTWQLPGEECPVDAEGNRLEPLATLFVPDLPEVPAALRNIALITIYAPEEAWAEDPEEKPQLGCVIRTYPTLEGLIPCSEVSSVWKTCILTPEPVKYDMPEWPDSGGGEENWDIIRALEKNLDKTIDFYRERICDAVYETIEKEKFPPTFAPGIHAVYETHKIGGYPTYTQCDPEFPADYPFVLQLNTDFDAELHIGDCGSYYLYYNAEKNDWRVYADCY